MTLVTRAEYHQLGETGFFGPDERVELIQGAILPMTPIDPLHAGAVDQANMLFTDVFRDTHVVRVQSPIGLGDFSEPEPDLVLIPLEVARAALRERRHPEQVDLVVEVSNTSLAFDRGRKARLYAQGGLANYWIINLRERRLEVHTRPVDGVYQSLFPFEPGQTVELLGRRLTVQDLFPPE